jgi:hypothetical protein
MSRKRCENGRPAVRPLRPREIRRSTNRKSSNWPVMNQWKETVSVRLRNRGQPRRPGLLGASEAPGLHRLIHDNSRRGRDGAVTQLLSTG